MNTNTIFVSLEAELSEIVSKLNNGAIKPESYSYDWEGAGFYYLHDTQKGVLYLTSDAKPKVKEFIFYRNH